MIITSRTENLWEQRQLGEVSQLNGRIGFRGYTAKDIISKESGGILTFSPTNIINNLLEVKGSNTYITREKYEESPEIQVNNSDILFVKTGSTLGKSALVSGLMEPATINPQIVIIRSQRKWIQFLSVLLMTSCIQKQITAAKIGGAVPTLTESEIKKFKFYIPNDLNETGKIGQFFSKIDSLIALYERKLKLLSRVKKYFLDNLFAEKKYPNLRFKGFTNVWEKIKLKDTQTTLTDGNYANLYPKPTDMTDADKGIPFLTGGNLKDGILNLKNAKYITKEKHSQLKSGHLEEDDIVIAVRGSLGELGYVTKQNIDWNINSQLAIIRTSKNELIGNFLLYFFLSSKGKSKLLSRQTGTALKQLPLQQLKTIVIPKTLLLEQQKISNILKTIDKTISFYKDKQQHFTEIKKTLLNTMFI